MNLEITLNAVEIHYKESGKTLQYNSEFLLPSKGFTVLRGESGCGKSTLLQAMAGLVPLQSGEILGVNPKQTVTMFQELRLFPWRTVEQHITDVCASSYSRHDSLYYLKLVGLEAEKGSKVSSLSGGMGRRLSLARGLAYGDSISAQLYLLDEPFTGIDPPRVESLLTLLEQLPVPVLLATHLPFVVERAVQILQWEEGQLLSKRKVM